MNLSRFALLALFVVALVHGPALLMASPGDVNATLASPCKHPLGLATDGKNLLVVDWRTAAIHEVNPADGKSLRSWTAPTLKPSGLALLHGLLFVSDDHSGGVFAMRLGDGGVDRAFQAPESSASGLAADDKTLFVLAKDRIYRVMPEDGTILHSFAAPEKSCGWMTYDGKYLWVSNRIKDEVYMLDADRGKVLGIIKTPGPYPTGIAWFDGHLWCADFQTRKLYQIVIHDQQSYRLFDQRRARAEYLWSLSNYGPGEIRDLIVGIAIPKDLPNQKLLSKIEFSRPPTRIADDRWGQQCAVYEISSVPAGKKNDLSYAVDAEVSAIRWLIFPDQVGTLIDIPADIRGRYTVDGSHLRVNSDYIRKTVRKVVGDEKNPYWIARKIYEFVIDKLEYEMTGGWDVPEEVLKRGKGSCSEYTYVFITLCRAAGIPARYQGSMVVRGDDASIDEAFHRWAEIYLPGYGWIPVDANHGDSPSPVEQARGFGELSNRFLITTIGGGDSEYLGWSYNSFARFQRTGYCKIDEDNFAVWEPLPSEATSQPAGKPSSAGTAKSPAQCERPGS